MHLRVLARPPTSKSEENKENKNMKRSKTSQLSLQKLNLWLQQTYLAFWESRRERMPKVKGLPSQYLFRETKA
jgi:hypothetical protein